MEISKENLIFIVGIVGSICTVICNIPQAKKTLKTRKTDDLSLVWLILLLITLGSWVTYGVLLNQLSLIIGNGLAVVSVIIITIVKIENERIKRRMKKNEKY